MNAPFDPTFLMNEKFAVGQPVSRKEDPVRLRGEGRYTDNLNLSGQLYGVLVRSRMAHGELRSIDADAAREMPGVHMIITAADLDAAGIRNMPAAAGKHGDAAPTTAAARDGSSALCRRADRHGGGGDEQAGEGRGGVDLR
jgi:aerobic carbon-monoxide dehydrogenase large subunit